MLKMDGLIIRNVEESDLSLLKMWNNQKARGAYQEVTFDSFENLKQRFVKDGFNSEYFKILFIENSDRGVGLVYVNFRREGLVSLGVVICEAECRQKGYGLMATNLIVEYLFANYPIIRIEADTDIDNIGAQKVLERAGFKKEGILRKYRFHHGEWRDSAIYSLIREDYCKLINSKSKSNNYSKSSTF